MLINQQTLGLVALAMLAEVSEPFQSSMCSGQLTVFFTHISRVQERLIQRWAPGDSPQAPADWVTVPWPARTVQGLLTRTSEGV